jgi:tetratricopeptide (TPR) repeat protein
MEVGSNQLPHPEAKGSVSQVKKDILNGWKEIAAYVARDRRTVERWEKLRGLPVRRMPGEGRATVYALISELDEWLASSKPDETEVENADPARTGSRTIGSGASEDGVVVPGAGAGSAAQAQSFAGNPQAGTELFAANTEPRENGAAEAAAEAQIATKIKGRNSAAVWREAGRWEQIASWTLLAGLGLYIVLALPAVRRGLHFGPGPNGASSGAASGGASKGLGESGSGQTSGAALGAPGSAPREHSQVAGVDDLYLAGVYSLEQRTPESLEHAEQDFASAIQKDAHYAPAYAGLADTYVLLREYYVMPDEEAYTKAKTAAEQAIALDPGLSEAHASLGFIDFFWTWDAASAEREFRTAIADDPSQAHAHHWYGSMLTHEGRYQVAMEQLNIAQRLEPTSAAILSTRALALGLSGHRTEAVEMLEGLINESPGVSSPHAILAIVSRVEPQDLGRYLDEMRRAGELRHSNEMLQVAAAGEPALRSGGERGMWTAMLATEEKLHPGNANRTFLMAEAETALGNDDAAFADLNQLAQRHDGEVMGVIIDPTLAPLRRDRRFRQLLEAVGLPLPQ